MGGLETHRRQWVERSVLDAAEKLHDLLPPSIQLGANGVVLLIDPEKGGEVVPASRGFHAHSNPRLLNLPEQLVELGQSNAIPCGGYPDMKISSSQRAPSFLLGIVAQDVVRWLYEEYRGGSFCLLQLWQ